MRINVPALKEYAKDDEGEYLTTVEFEVAGTLYSVKLDGATIASDLAPTDHIILTDTSKLTPGATYITGKAAAADEGIDYTPVPAGADFGLVSALVSKAKNGVIELNTAYSVIPASSG